MKYHSINTHAIAAILAVASIMAAMPEAHAQNLLTNPSFELGAFVDQGGGFMNLASGDSVTITGWTVSSNLIAWGKDTPTNSSSIDALDGDFFLDLQGPGVGSPFGGVTQTLTTVIGQQYHLSFNLGTQESSAFCQGPVSVNATAGTTTLPFTFAPSGTGTQWGEFSFDFTATSTSTPITFQGTATAGGAYIGVDQVSVTTVPEPSSALLIAFGGLGMLQRWRRVRKAGA